MPAKRPNIPKRIEKLLYQEVGSQCPVCGESDIVKLTIHHIEPWSECREHDPLKMIVLCANCHARAEAGDIDRATLYRAKLKLRIVRLPATAGVAQHVMGDNNAVAGRDVNIRVTARSRRRVLPRPAGTVCDDPRKVGYLQYLAKRYNQFKEWEVGKPAMKYGFIHKAFEREIKYAIRTTPLDRFETAASWLQERIRGTKLGRILSARGQLVFSAFDEFDGQGEFGIPAAQQSGGTPSTDELIQRV